MKNISRGSISGFTLIELLVVVLIIGILSAVALPQYTKVVWKSRFSEALTISNSLEKSLELYLLEKGYPSALTSLTPDELSVDVLSSLKKNKDKGYCSKYVCYSVGCYSSHCFWTALVYKDAGLTTLLVNAFASNQGNILESTNGSWYRSCYYEDEIGKSLCQSTVSLGWQDVSEGF